jgi:hypothetical protein
LRDGRVKVDREKEVGEWEKRRTHSAWFGLGTQSFVAVAHLGCVLAVDARLERLRVVRVDGEERGVVVAVDPALGVRLGTFDGADVGGLSLKKSGREKQREGGGV